MALPVLKMAKSFLDVVLGKEKPAMTFEVGVGLTPEQKIAAEAKVKEVAEVGKILPEPMKPEFKLDDAYKIQTYLWTKQKRGEQLTPNELALGKEAGKVIQDNMIEMVVGFIAPEAKAIKAVIPKELQPLAREARKYKSAEEFVKTQQGKKGIADKFHNWDISQGNFREVGGKKYPIRGWFSTAQDFYNQAVRETTAITKVAVKGVKPIEQKVVVKVPSLTEVRQAISKLAKPKSITGKVPQLPPQLLQKVPRISEVSPYKPIVSPIEESVNKITQALKEAKPVRAKQEALYAKERATKMAKAIAVGKKVEGEAGFYAELGQLKGEYTRVQFESIKGKVSQADIDNLFKKVKDSVVLNFWQGIQARTGLVKIFEGKVPTEGELALLGRVFPKEFIDTVLGKRSLFTKLLEYGYQLGNLPRSVMASFDLSAPFRQGLFLIGYPKQFFASFVKMFKAFGSEKAFKALQETIVKKPTFDLMQESNLALTEMDRILTQREERFMSQWAERIPIAGKIIRASGRAYVGFLNKLRADVFEDLILKAEKIGRAPRSNPDLVKSIANFVNTASGRGDLGALQRAAVALNSFLFSPRLMASRLTLLNPIYYIKQDSFVRKEALKSLFVVSSMIATVLGLSKLGGVEVETDMRSSDFAKIKIGNTRIDIMAGFQQYIRMAAQLITGKYISTTTGKEITLGEGYKPLTRMDILLRQIESKEAPIVSFITDLLRQQDYKGEKISVINEIISRFYPMAINDIVDVAKDDPTLLPISVLGIFGVGIQTYEPTYGGGLVPGMPSMKMPEGAKLPSLKMPPMPSFK